MAGSVLEKTKAARATLAEVAAAIDALESKHPFRAVASVATGLPAPLDRLGCGILHEWLCPCDPWAWGRAWTAPLLLFAHLARQCMHNLDAPQGELVVWVGRRLWPQPQALFHGVSDRQRRLLHRSLLIDPATDAERLWAIDLCLRSPVVAAVAADGSGMPLPHSRRLQLAAENGRVLALLARPAQELSTPSAAAMRWRVQPHPSPTDAPRWRVELLRCKGLQRSTDMEVRTSLVLEHHHETGGLRVPPDLVDRPNPATQRSTVQRTA